ncbi:MAG: CBS domain-containing protein [Myxococcota bacterium]|nr:CBS domain-containing protein [Myxococcota bacterium]
MDLRKLDRVPAIAAVMTPFPYSVAAEDPVTAAEDLMKRHELRHLPVEDGGKLVGIVTQRDLALRINQALRPDEKRRIRVRQLYVPDPFVVETTEPLDRVVRTMAERHLGSVLVTKNGRLAGIFTVTDACRVLADVLAARFRPDGGEAA